jgi:phosphoribosyl-AMP cyclohydrolase
VAERPRVPEPERLGENGGVTENATATRLDPAVAALLTRDAAGLVAAVVQQHDTGEVLMVGWMNDEALVRTLTTGRVTFWSRSRQELWRKGDTSGHTQWVRSVALDCDGDALLVRVDQVGPACHTGAHSCFETHPLEAVVGVPDATADASADGRADTDPPEAVDG